MKKIVVILIIGILILAGFSLALAFYPFLLPTPFRLIGLLPCKFLGKEINNGGFAGPFCYTPNKDAGKECRSSEDCQDLCLVGNPNESIGRCSKGVNFGCFTYLNENGQMQGLCAD